MANMRDFDLFMRGCKKNGGGVLALKINSIFCLFISRGGANPKNLVRFARQTEGERGEM